MLVKKSLITSKFDPLTGSDKVEAVKARMEAEDIQTLPVVDTTTHTLIGQVHYSDLPEDETDRSISDLELDEPVKVYRGQHLFEAVRLMLQYERKAIPVVDKEWTMLGVIEKECILDMIPQMLNLTESGSVISVTLEPIDFSISEMVNIIETENAKILGVTVERPNHDAQTYEVSFKLDLQDVSRVAAALRRYDYVVSTNSENEIFSQDLENRADELLKYIDM
ncbi:CBS domain-containing protein [Fodinibius salsisoli]|uniref:CBS domain-containing protein n=1 Tax=Fodinibius salsisoli TaxID=2820877 RepID=A0ABT3PRU6_9BACT|nr:CBS domain-containing protein [Fodinibius salsisoli]MCW9708583.1 CBS domain-containing protein [Fodinibius salsisoli]